MGFRVQKSLLGFVVSSFVALQSATSAELSRVRLPEASTLFAYSVFAKESIVGRASDFQGATGAGGAISLRNFYIGGNLSSADSIELDHASVSRQVLAPKIVSKFAGGRSVVKSARYSNEAGQLAEEMDSVSARLAQLQPAIRAEASGGAIHIYAAPNVVTIVEIRAEDLANGTDLFVQGASSSTVVVNVRGAAVLINKTGFFYAGGIKANNVIFNFPEAETLALGFSGAPMTVGGFTEGVPGTILAPYADFQFVEALVTGGVYVRSIQYGWPGEQPFARTGQVNAGCFRGQLLGIGCQELPPAPPAPPTVPRVPGL